MRTKSLIVYSSFLFYTSFTSSRLSMVWEVGSWEQDTGISKVTVVPLPGVLSICHSPFNFSIRDVILRIPIPFFLLVLRKPLPSSVIVTCKVFSLAAKVTVTFLHWACLTEFCKLSCTMRYVFILISPLSASHSHSLSYTKLQFIFAVLSTVFNKSCNESIKLCIFS